MDIIPRAGWGARPPRHRFLIATPTPKLWLHHTASPTGGPARVRAIQNFHMDVRGWSDIAYSYLVSAAGKIYEGRGAGVAGGHTAGQNTVSHAICAMGNYDTTQPSDVMLDSIRALLAYGHAQGWWPAQFTGGHRDAPGAVTSCPGAKLYALIPDLNTPIQEDDLRFIEAKGETGPHVEYWQRIMMAIDVPWKPTVFGVWNDHSIAELQDLTGPGDNLGPGEAAVLHTRLAQQGPPASGVNDARVRQLVSETGRTLFVEKGQPVVIRGS